MCLKTLLVIMASAELLFPAYVFTRKTVGNLVSGTWPDLIMAGLPPPVTEHECQTAENAPTSSAIKELYKTILNNYDTRIRPRENQTDGVEINTTFVLNNIVKLDVTSQILSVRGYFYLKWYDEFLQWNPCEHSGVTYLKFSLEEIWIPILVILKGAGETSAIYKGSDRIVVTSDGIAAWAPEGTYSMFCDINIKFYPLEKQICSLTIYASDESSNEVYLDFIDDGGAVVSLDHFSKNSEWEFIKLSAKREVRYNTSMIDIVFVTKRRPGFILYTTLLPLVLLTVLNICTFLVPIESGEKGPYRSHYSWHTVSY